MTTFDDSGKDSRRLLAAIRRRVFVNLVIVLILLLFGLVLGVVAHSIDLPSLPDLPPVFLPYP